MCIRWILCACCVIRLGISLVHNIVRDTDSAHASCDGKLPSCELVFGGGGEGGWWMATTYCGTHIPVANCSAGCVVCLSLLLRRFVHERISAFHAQVSNVRGSLTATERSNTSSRSTIPHYNRSHVLLTFSNV